MISEIFFLVAGLFLLGIGADWLVKGGSSTARRFKISPMIIGMTIVAVGTSSPELVVSLKAAFEGSGSIAMGNVVGSNICNILLILGVAALIRPLPVQRAAFRVDLPALLVSSILLMIVFFDLELTRAESFVLIAATIVYFILSLRIQQSEAQHKSESGEWILMKTWKSLFYILFGLGGLLLGAHWLVESAQSLAEIAGWDEGIAGLFLVALGTSLPELAAAIAASIRSQGTLLLGSIVGSNIFNTLVIPGISFLIFPGAAPFIDIFNMWIMLGVTILLIPLMFTGGRLSRFEGGFLSIAYLIYIYFLMG